MKHLNFLGKCKKGDYGEERGQTLQMHLARHGFDWNQKLGWGGIASVYGSAIVPQRSRDELT